MNFEAQTRKWMTMTERIRAADLPVFDSVRYLDSEEAITAYLADIRAANDPELLAAALKDVARARRASVAVQFP
ncbi:DNA-binding protein [Herbaspirillum sp. NPDC087042]|uniref:helix-turn-helix domain-containing transcriptional regulator n=1 Tax=Herbaspirillum sp. NPDC087042 TaxID=3364004 RepID=UPI00380616E0